MIKSITVTNYLNESLTIDLRHPEQTGIVVRKIEGLGPCKANINAKEMATGDGAVYNSARVNSRNIVLTLGFLFKNSIEDVRQLTYKYFPIKKNLKFLIETDNRIAETIGYVEENTPNIFSKDETTQISIICPDPYFYSAGESGKNVTVFAGVEPTFEFPFSNESLNQNLLELGQVQYSKEKVIAYQGDSEVGIVITINAIGEASNIVIHNTRTRETMTIDTTKLEQLTGSGIIKGDEIQISTVKGNKYINLLRDGVYTNILNTLTRDSDWFSLTKGDNIFAYTADEGAANLLFKIENRVIYEGV